MAGEICIVTFLAEVAQFAYVDSWENRLLGDEYNPCLINLTAGEHPLTMNNMIGDMKSTIDVLKNMISNLNEWYLSVIMIIGNGPDPEPMPLSKSGL